MKATGIVRHVDELGRVVLPIELRRMFGIEEKDGLEIYVEDDAIILRKYRPGCEFCGSVNDVYRVGSHCICRSCTEYIYHAFMAKRDEA